MELGSPERNGLVIREWKWCPSKEQRTCEEVCLNNLHVGKCIKTEKECRVKLNQCRKRLRSDCDPPTISLWGKLIKLTTTLILLKLKKLGPKRISTLFYEEDMKNKRVLRDISENVVSGWIRRGKVPSKFREAVNIL